MRLLVICLLSTLCAACGTIYAPPPNVATAQISLVRGAGAGSGLQYSRPGFQSFQGMGHEGLYMNDGEIALIEAGIPTYLVVFSQRPTNFGSFDCANKFSFTPVADHHYVVTHIFGAYSCGVEMIDRATGIAPIDFVREAGSD